jgi:hypothetical protein
VDLGRELIYEVNISGPKISANGVRNLESLRLIAERRINSTEEAKTMRRRIAIRKRIQRRRSVLRSKARLSVDANNFATMNFSLIAAGLNESFQAVATSS